MRILSRKAKGVARSLLVVSLLLVFVLTVGTASMSIIGHGIGTQVASANSAGQTQIPLQIDGLPSSETDDTKVTRHTHYTDDFGEQQVVDNSWQASVAPWNWEMTHDQYNVRVKEDITAGQVIEFENKGETVYLQPMNLEWTNDFDQIQLISTPTGSSPAVDHEQVEILPSIFNDMGYVRWDDAYGSGIDFKWQCTPGLLGKELIIDSFNDLPVPAQYIIDGGNPVLRLNLIFDPPDDGVVDILVDGEVWDRKTKVQTFDEIEFAKDGEVLWRFNLLEYWDSGTGSGQSDATLRAAGNKLYIEIRVPYSWLQTASYPVYVDADVTIEAFATYIYTDNVYSRGGIYWTTPLIGYVFYVNNASPVYRVVYRKTVDGGATWGAQVNVTGTLTWFFDSYADWQTSGDAGTKIHIAYIDTTAKEVRYVYLDTSDDSIGGDDLIETCQGSGTFSTVETRVNFNICITKTRGGNIGVVFRYKDSNGATHGKFYTSPDENTWTSEATPWEGSSDYLKIYPSNEADDQDIWGIFWDISGNNLSLKTYDDSGNSWSEQAIDNDAAESTVHLQFDSQIRLSDGHLILAFWSQYDNGAADLRVYDINGAGSITAKTNLITDEPESYCVSVFINQDADDIYVAYLSGTSAHSAVKCFYDKSDDGGATWDGETAMQADAEDDERYVSCGAVKAAWGGIFMPVWYNDDRADLDCNTDNAISIAAATGEADISITPSSKDYGVIVWNNTYDTGLTYFTATNNSGGAVTIAIKATDPTTSGWTLSDTATPGVKIVGLKAGLEGGDYTIIVKKTPAYNTLVSGLAAEGTQKWGLRLYAPTAFDNGDGAGSITVTIDAALD